MAYGFMFDFDGTISQSAENDSGVDEHILRRIAHEYKKDHRFAILTGRSGWYIEEQLEPAMRACNVYDKILILGDFGFYKVMNGIASWDYDETFLRQRPVLKNVLSPYMPNTLKKSGQ